MTTGAEALLETLINAGVEICFANPGTSEMHLVAAIGKSDRMRPILCLFEGTATGAADGYARMTGKPAITLLHLGPGLANGMANLHNAKRAHIPLVNIVGDHATYHLQYDAPLTSDVPAHAALHAGWLHSATTPDDLAASGARAVHASLQGAGQIATLIAPANLAWEASDGERITIPPDPRKTVAPKVINGIAKLLGNGKKTGLLLGGEALRESTLSAAGRIAEATDATIFSDTFPTRFQRGAGRFTPTRIPYFAEQAVELLAEFEQLILVGTRQPVAFFAYPDTPSILAPANCVIESLVDVDADIGAALEALAIAVNAPTTPSNLQQRQSPQEKSPEFLASELTPQVIGQCLCALLPENAIVSDEGISAGLPIFEEMHGAAPHDWLAITGGAIGQGLPVSLGAAIACPDRKVIALQADGSAMYTVQTLWSMAREKADVTIVLLNNRSYAILNYELARLQTGTPTEKTLSMLDLSNPDIDWLAIAQSFGIAASRAITAAEFSTQFAHAMATPGPHLIETLVVQNFD